jgi:hypothetical protein
MDIFLAKFGSALAHVVQTFAAAFVGYGQTEVTATVGAEVDRH